MTQASSPHLSHMSPYEPLFRAYETALQQIVSKYPQPSTITFTGASPSTVRQHLKSALYTYINTPSIQSVIPRDQAACVLREFAFSQNLDGSVYIGPRRASRTRTTVNLATDSTETSIQPVDVSNEATLHAILHLKNFDILPFPVQLVNLSPIKLPDLQAQYPNVELIQLNESTYTVL